MTSMFSENDNIPKDDENVSDTFDEEKVNRVDEMPEKFDKFDHVTEDDSLKHSTQTMKSSFPVNASNDECIFSDDPAAGVFWAEKCLQSMPKCKFDDMIDEKKRKLENEISTLLDQMENYDKALESYKDKEKIAQSMDCTVAAEEICAECKKTRNLEKELKLIRAQILEEEVKDEPTDQYCYKTAVNKILHLQLRLENVRSEAIMKDYCLETCRDSVNRMKSSIQTLKGDVKQMEKIASEYSKEINNVQKGVREEPSGQKTKATNGPLSLQNAPHMDPKKPYGQRAEAGCDSFTRSYPTRAGWSNKSEKFTDVLTNLPKKLHMLQREGNLIPSKLGSHSGQTLSSVPSPSSSEATNESPYELDSEEEHLLNVKGFKYFTFDKFELSPTEEYNLYLKGSDSFSRAIDPFRECFTSSRSEDSYSDSKLLARSKPPVELDVSESASELITTDTNKRTTLSNDNRQRHHFRAGRDADNHSQNAHRINKNHSQKVEIEGVHKRKRNLKKTVSERNSHQKFNNLLEVCLSNNNIISTEGMPEIAKQYENGCVDRNRHETNSCGKSISNAPFKSRINSDHESNSANENSHKSDAQSTISEKAKAFSSSEQQCRIYDTWKARDLSSKNSTIPSLFACNTKQSLGQPLDNVSSTISTSLKEQFIVHKNEYSTFRTAKVSQLSDELAILRGQNKVLESRLKTESMKLNLKEQEIQTLLSENNAFQQNFYSFSTNQIYTSSVDLVKQISKLEDKISKLTSQNESTLNDFQDCEKKFKICRKNLEYCMKELNRPVDEVLQLRIPPEDASKQQWIQFAKKLYIQLKMSKVTISRHGLLLRIAKKQRHQFMLEIENLKKKLQDTYGICNSTGTENENDLFKRESARMEILIKDLEGVNAELSRQNASSICEMQKCKDKLLFYEKQLQVLSELVDNRDMTNDFEKIRQEIDKLKEELEEKTAQVEKLASQLERSNEVINVYQAELEKYKASNYRTTLSSRRQQVSYKPQILGRMFAGNNVPKNSDIDFGQTLCQANNQTEVADTNARHMHYLYCLLQKELESIIQKARTKKRLKRNEAKLQQVYETIAWMKKIEGHGLLEEICLRSDQNEFNNSHDKQLAKICAKVIKQDIKTLHFKELAYLYYAVYKTAAEHSLDCQSVTI